MEIRALGPRDRPAWLALRQALWPHAARAHLVREQDEILAAPERNGVFGALSEGGALAGFAEVSLRDWAEGCSTRPVGYLEGWYVRPEHRRSGVGASLVRAAEAWAREKGCTEMGSDALLDNVVSHRAHEALGYTEVERQVVFRRALDGESSGEDA